MSSNQTEEQFYDAQIARIKKALGYNQAQAQALYAYAYANVQQVELEGVALEIDHLIELIQLIDMFNV